MKEFTVYQNETDEWIVQSKKIPGFSARGRTMQEALDKMKQAMRVYFPCGECKGSD
ncbi:hypothetical protein BMS3Abin09_00495 [bacterium BMS3Abin09]|nr:hypothetical protein BMS3Abin09_00495 [bacterium BMS3Abin09]